MTGLAGALFETFVAVELERQASWMPSPISFWHYRDGEREIDIMIEAPSGEVVGIEVKPGATVRPTDFSGLTQAANGSARDFAVASCSTAANRPCRSQTGPGPSRWPPSLADLSERHEPSSSVPQTLNP